MAVKIRLRRMGRKKRPFYRVVAADSRAPRDGRFIEQIGYYNPLTDPATVELNEDRALYWLGVGALPSPTVKNLLSKKGIILKFDLAKRGLSEEQMQDEMQKWEKLQIEKQRRWELQQKLADDQKAIEKTKKEEEKTKKETAEPEVTETALIPEKSETVETAEETKESESINPEDTVDETKATETDQTIDDVAASEIGEESADSENINKSEQ